ncbi:MAG: N(G),N(G)-dimethylarginine dimethylaminohydrolase [Candidatus Eremiobacteraeota bacterium]|nr:N(G),N(G)-dimethylarginine dimethylaminohydrolase [Candidatus Eremiobacteraeota bacterium]
MLGAPSVAKALEQHAAYCEALHAAGVASIVMESDARFPDAHFVEDAAVLIGGRAMLARPGHPARRDEAASLRPALVAFFTDLAEIDPPGTLDGGDVCDAGDRVYVGLSHRTNANGIAQLGAWLERDAKTLIVIDIRNRPGLLHLKSGMSFLGDGRFAAVEVVAPLIGTRGQDVIVVQRDEAFAANCVRVNGVVFVAAGFPNFNAALKRAGFLTVALEVSEFRKMDGGLSCLSLRF